jgi:hypothetical protein
MLAACGRPDKEKALKDWLQRAWDDSGRLLTVQDAAHASEAIDKGFGPGLGRGSPRGLASRPSGSGRWVRSARPAPAGSPPMSAARTANTGSMGSLPPDASPPISLPAQQGHLLHRYPHSRVVRRGEHLVWSGTLTSTEYSATYELLIDHQIGKPPLVYVARPRLRLVDGQGLPHVYPLNTLCLFLGNREWHQSIPIADTLVPWASEWCCSRRSPAAPARVW